MAYVWLDLGLNFHNQITLTATGVNKNNKDVAHVALSIVFVNAFKFSDAPIP